jgi:hypothetical protein
MKLSIKNNIKYCMYLILILSIMLLLLGDMSGVVGLSAAIIGLYLHSRIKWSEDNEKE